MKRLYENTAIIEAARSELSKAIRELAEIEKNIIKDEYTPEICAMFEEKYKQHIENANKYIKEFCID